MPRKDPEARRAYGKAYRAKNKERALASSNAWNAAHPEILKARSAAHYKANTAKVLAGNARWRKLNPEKSKACGANWRAKNPEKDRARHADYNAAHPEKIRAKSARYRARKQNAPINDLTTAQWEEIKVAFGFRCAYQASPGCRGRVLTNLTMDHVIPISKGGSHTASNIVPACQSCNSRKHAGQPLIPVQPLLLTSSPPDSPKGAITR